MALRIHHLNCTTLCPPGGRLTDARGPGHATLVCHCLLVETDTGLLLVDTGFGLQDVLETTPRLSPLLLGVIRPQLNEGQTAIRQLERLGFKAEDVRDIVLTHLDFDHAGGLDDFPHARVHLLADELRAARAQATPLDRRRYRPRQWVHEAHWETYPVPRGERWYGFDAVRELSGLPPEVLLVPLAGHTLGHAGVALYSEGRWLLHAGDAYFFHGEMNLSEPHCPPVLRAYQTLMEKDRKLRLHNQERLRELVRLHSDEVTVFCAHDAEEFEWLEEGERVPPEHPFRLMPAAPEEAPAPYP